MQSIKSFFSFKVGMLTFVGIFGLVSSVVALAPRKMATTKAENCSNAPTIAALNPFPVSWEGTTGIDCTDAPAIAIRPVNSATGSYSSNVNAQSGDEFYVRIYVHNGARQGLDYQQTTAYGVNGGINISGGRISTTFTASRGDGSGGFVPTNSVSDSVSVTIPSGAVLELVPGSGEFFNYQGSSISGNSADLSGQQGSFDMGEMQACFEFSKFLRFKAKVVGPAPEPAPAPQGSGQISASLGGEIAGQCLYYGNINWSSQNINEVIVTVSDPDLNSDNYYNNDKIFAKYGGGNETVNWIEPNKAYRFSLWEINPSSGGQTYSFRNSSGRETVNAKRIDESWMAGGADNFCQTPAPIPPVGNISAAGAVKVLGQCMFKTTVSWSSSNTNGVKVTVRDPVSGAENEMSRELSGTTNDTAWMQPNRDYRFSIWNIKNGAVQTPALDDTWVTTPACEVPPTPVPVDYTLNINSNSYCVGTTPQYSITARRELAGKKILWTSKKDNVLTGEINTDYGFYLTDNGSNAVWSAYGNPWTLANIGSWEKIAKIDNVAKSVTFVVRDCSTPAPVCPTNVPLSVNPSSIKVDSTAAISAPSGWSNGSFNSNNSSVASVNGGTVRGNAQGSAYISGSGFTAPNGATNCALSPATITVTYTPPPAPVCPMGSSVNASPSNIKVSEYAAAYAPSGWTGGNFTSNNSNVASMSGNSIKGNAQGSAYISGSGFTAPNGATNCALSPATITVTYTPPPAPVCPTNGSSLISPAIIYVNEYSTASAPAGWTGGNFTSNNPQAANIIDGVRGTSLKGFSAGIAYISGSGFTAPNGALNCELTSAQITVKQRPVLPPTQVTATATASAAAEAYASCPNGSTASAKATASATATATAATQSEAGKLAYDKAYAQAQALAYAQAQAKVVCAETPPPPPPAQLTCNPLNQSVDISQTVYFTASGGMGEYTWKANGGNTYSGNGSQFNTSYSNAGSKTVAVTSGSQSANCYAEVRQPQVNQLVCTTLTSEVEINRDASFRATGGTDAYTWLASGGNPVNGSGSNFSTKYSFSGYKSVFVTSGNQTMDCSVRVKEPVEPNAIMELSKTVKNLDASGDYAHNISAKQGEKVEYKIVIRAATNVKLKNVRVTDEMPLGLVYESGSLKVNNQPHAPGLTSGGLFFDSIDQNGVEIRYRAAVNVNTGTLVNFARGTADNAVSREDRANIQVIYIPAGQPALSIVKEVKNLGPSQTTGYGSQVSARMNDSAQYRIVVKNSGNASANDVILSDASTIINGATSLNVSKSYTGSIQTGVHLNTLSENETVIITYIVKVTKEQGEITNTAAVSALNAATQKAIAIVNVIKDSTPTTTTGGNCNNSGNSCNNNNNTNTGTNNNSTNSSNQSNQNNVNGNNNTITNSNQNCVNNSCNNTNIAYVSTAGSTVQGNDFRQLSITKLARSVNGGAFQDSVSVNNNDLAEFEIVVRNTGNQVVNNVQMTDSWNGQMSLVSGTLRVDGNYLGDNLNNINLGSLLSGQQKRVTFQARVNSGSNQSIQNIARAWGDFAGQVQDDAWVFVNYYNPGCTVNCGSVQGGSVNLVYSKRAVNETKNTDATSVAASREDYITYTLTVTNTGNTQATSFIITDDISQVLPYADMVDNGGGILSGNVISYPGITIPAGGSVSKSFKVRVKYNLASNLSYTMTNTYGNTITVRINTPQVLGAFVAPKTGGPSVAAASIFGSLMAGALGVIRNRRKVWELIVD